MQAPTPTILALDFDGVVCDGLIEYFQTAWRAYCELWTPDDATPPQGLADQFYRLRPVVETGWEMPVLLRSLQSGTTEDAITSDWGTLAQQQAAADGLAPAHIGATVDRIRDEWITTDLENWLAQHRFYPGVIERLQQIANSAVYPVIVTTKEGRFVRQLLSQQGVNLTDAQIRGKEQRQPKADTLRQLMQELGTSSTEAIALWFVEDRLKTLQTIKQYPDLAQVQLFLADWGYNTASDHAIARQDDRIHLLSLPDFPQDWQNWLHSTP